MCPKPMQNFDNVARGAWSRCYRARGGWRVFPLRDASRDGAWRPERYRLRAAPPLHVRALWSDRACDRRRLRGGTRMEWPERRTVELRAVHPMPDVVVCGSMT
jgi:hypothetical protein